MAIIFGKSVLNCNGIDPFLTIMGNFNWGPISRNNIVSIFRGSIQNPALGCDITTLISLPLSNMVVIPSGSFY